MSFLYNAHKYLESLNPNGYEHCLLMFLMKHAVGSANAKSWKVIDFHLRASGFNIRKQLFQQGLLKKTRIGDVFIGSNDHGDSSGYFIMNSREDVEVMAAWYRKRIATETERLDHLLKISGIS